MGKKKNRKDRWDDRANLKKAANKKGQIKAMHPQVRKQLQEKVEL
jgi:hypothetical protein